MKLDKEKKKKIIIYIVSSVFCIIVNFVYSLFSHGVHSNYMTFMFLIPLLLGIINVLVNIHKNIVTIGFFTKGIFEIAGTSSKYQAVYYVVGLVLYLGSFIFAFKKQ